MVIGDMSRNVMRRIYVVEKLHKDWASLMRGFLGKCQLLKARIEILHSLLLLIKKWEKIKKAYEIYLKDDNFIDGKQIKSLSSLTKKILYKKDDFEFTQKN